MSQFVGAGGDFVSYTRGNLRVFNVLLFWIRQSPGQQLPIAKGVGSQVPTRSNYSSEKTWNHSPRILFITITSSWLELVTQIS